jgi:nitrate reductase gamma subunit
MKKIHLLLALFAMFFLTSCESVLFDSQIITRYDTKNILWWLFMLGFSILPNFEPKSLMVKNDIRNESEKKKDLKFAIVSWVLALIPLTLFLVIIFTSSNYVLKNGEEKYVIDVVNYLVMTITLSFIGVYIMKYRRLYCKGKGKRIILEDYSLILLLLFMVLVPFNVFDDLENYSDILTFMLILLGFINLSSILLIPVKKN